ncbi:MAG: FAD-binding oxidoreductase [Oceanococcus sp.]
MLSNDQINELQQLHTGLSILSDPAECLSYGYDNSKQQAQPDAVALASETPAIAALARWCSDNKVPLVTRGAGTNTVGATVPTHGGVVLSLEQMDQILEFSPENQYLRCQGGTRNGAVQNAAGQAKLFWAPDPTSSGFSTVGGNLGCNAGGPRAVKYGTCRDNILGVTAVTGDGRIIQTGCRTTKGVVGYDLTRLLVGSEGTLAIITEATLLLRAQTASTWSVRAAYSSVEAATQAVSTIMAQPARPCALEFMDATAVRLVRENGAIDLPEQTKALLLIDIDGDEEQLQRDCAAIERAAAHASRLDWLVATDADDSRALWQARKALSPCLRSLAPKKINEDVVVPVSRLPELIHQLEKFSQRYNLSIVNFGHAGNGNVHVNILLDPDNPKQMAAATQCLEAVFDLVLSLGGTLSGEHGVGTAKRDFVDREIDPETLQLMRQLKAVFDPQNILNPGKTLPDAKR